MQADAANLNPAQLEALAAAVSEGTFEAAAGALHVTPSAISQRIKALETMVGRVLLTRGKPVQPTPSGELLLRLARQIQMITADAVQEIRRADSLGAPGRVVIPLAVNADSLATWLLPALAAVSSSLLFDLHRDDQERTAELLRQGAVMAAVTSSADAVPGCSVERLGRMRYRPTASPAFIDRWFADGATVASLARAPVVVFDRGDRLQDDYLATRSRRTLDPPRHHVPGSGAFLEAVRLGLGWGMVPDLQNPAVPVGPPVGPALVPIEPRGRIDVDLYWQQWRLRSPSLDLVADAVRVAAAEML
ncbi:LysR family transcriptional regulator [Jatrophihabitans sp. GAS493]|uniref:LysR family transcriptional regulator ArgP n=1 Tax=Jatrophihabitans sp. GAS493 TaxID=1907575 RepID=UPI000BB7C184|nr:LysR family transcriptional regulator ArgP [Jatrophihabitans sp. GAS493]SOD71009.1 LysR family transcriptional regulator [Jatrophihabitans sp. GAS493]